VSLPHILEQVLESASFKVKRINLMTRPSDRHRWFSPWQRWLGRWRGPTVPRKTGVDTCFDSGPHTESSGNKQTKHTDARTHAHTHTDTHTQTVQTHTHIHKQTNMSSQANILFYP
jgi:hypothetical protein